MRNWISVEIYVSFITFSFLCNFYFISCVLGFLSSISNNHTFFIMPSLCHSIDFNLYHSTDFKCLTFAVVFNQQRSEFIILFLCHAPCPVRTWVVIALHNFPTLSNVSLLCYLYKLIIPFFCLHCVLWVSDSPWLVYMSS